MPDPSRPTLLAPETERCDFCLQPYVYELEFRCFDCDRPICPICVVTIRARRESRCPECVPGEG